MLHETHSIKRHLNASSTTTTPIELQPLNNANANSKATTTTTTTTPNATDNLSTLVTDQHYKRVYQYYAGKGIYSILMARIFSLLTMAFVVSFSTFLFSCIDHKDIANKPTLADSLIDGCLTTLNPFHQILLILFACVCAWECVSIVMDIGPLRQMHTFYASVLQIPDSDMQSVHWNQVVYKLVSLNHSNSRLNAHDIANKIMRKDNYLIALFNKDLLDLSIPLPKWLLFGVGGKQMLTKVLEWHINVCIVGFVFGSDNGGVRRHFLRDVQRSKLISGLQRRMFMMGLLNLLFSPFILVALIIYFFFKYGEELHKNPTQLSARTYSPLARWKFRDFNELPHTFQSRLNASYPQAVKYINQFPQHKVAIIAKFISFIAGSCALALAFLSILDDDFLIKFHITPGRSVIWYLGVFSMIWTAARGFVPDPHLVYDPEVLLMEVCANTHYMPQDWHAAGLHSDYVRREFSNLFEYRVVLFAQELFSVLLAPFVLWFSLPSCAPKIVDFFREFTVHVDGVGWVCSFAVFDFRQFNNERGIISQPAGFKKTTSKMEQSAVSFKRQHPEWQPRDPANAEIIGDLLKHEEEAIIHMKASMFMYNDASASMISSLSAPGSSSFKHPTSTATSRRGMMNGLDLANVGRLPAGSTILEGGSIPYVPYQLYRDQQQSQGIPPSATRPTQSSIALERSVHPTAGYSPPPVIPDDEEN